MAWLEIHQTLPTHRKTLAAADALDMAPVHFMGHIIAFWLWAIDNAEDGNLDGVSPRMLARAAQWEGDPETLVNTMIDVGFIDRDGDSLSIHDWHDYAGKLIEQRKKERERKRRDRAKKRKAKQEKSKGSPPDERRTSEGHPADVQDVSGGCPEDVRRTSVENPRLQYSTVQYLKNKDVCASANAAAQVSNNTETDEGDAGETGTQSGDGRAVGQDPDRKSGEQRARTPFRSKVQEERFDAFWSHYPKKRSKGRAEKAWVKITPDPELFAAILAGLERAKASSDWQKDGGKFVPYPATWLNARGWEDEFEPPKRGNSGVPEYLRTEYVS